MKGNRNAKTLLIAFSGIAAIALIAGLFMLKGGSTEEKGQTIGFAKGGIAPDFEVTTIDGKNIKLHELTAQKKPMLLYFFATWCPYCHEDFENAKRAYPKYRENVEFVAVSLDLRENREKLDEYRKQNSYEWDFAPGNGKILSDYAVTSTTRKHAIGKNGTVLWFGAGPVDEKTWNILFRGLAES